MDLRGHGLSDAPTDGYDPDLLAEDAIAVAEGAGLLALEDDPLAEGPPGGRRFVVAGHGYGAIVEPPEVLASMTAWLADREAFDPATWGADGERAARSEVVETAAGRVKLAIHGRALAASVGAMRTFEPRAVLPAVEAGIVALAARDDDAGGHAAALREVAALRAGAGRPAIRVAAFPGLGHDLPRHVPGVVAAAILAAARGTPDADRGTLDGASG